MSYLGGFFAVLRAGLFIEWLHKRMYNSKLKGSKAPCFRGCNYKKNDEERNWYDASFKCLTINFSVRCCCCCCCCFFSKKKKKNSDSENLKKDKEYINFKEFLRIRKLTESLEHERITFKEEIL